MFSGVLGELLLKSKKSPHHCTEYPRQMWDEMNEAIIKPLLEEAVNSTIDGGLKLFASPCFRMLQYPSNAHILYGHPVIQTERC